MQQLEVKLGKRAYPILIGPGLLGSKELLARHAGAAKLLVVTDESVGPLWLPRLEAGLAGREYATCVLPGGEQQKTLGNVATIIDALVSARVTRDGAVLALGGGVIGDIAGFAAASYQRGIAIVQLPTTLLAQVDSSVGGKTGVNHPGGKNLIGAFHQPSAVLSDTDTLSTLPERELRAGFAEIVKAALVADAAFFAWLESNGARVLAREPAALAEAIRRACEIKAAIVASDEREEGRRALLNLGHTFGHAIEAGAGYGELLHGEAVATGLALAAELSARTGRMPQAEAARVRKLLSSTGLPADPPRLGRERMLELMSMDKKVKGGQVRLVLLDGIGSATVTADYPREALEALLEERAGP
ncbi:MAG TPA: 3-dehydroquinate synthase [Steroidobacteraceae bacterium]|nr:3-dehydroquinate synthase [Steroidobacteraceae bacterium]